MALYFGKYMKKSYFILSIFIMFFLVGCSDNSDYTYKDVEYFVNSIDVAKKSYKTDEVTALLTINFGANGALVGEAANSLLSTLQKGNSNLYEYNLLIQDDTIQVSVTSDYSRLTFIGPLLYNQYDKITVRSRCKQLKNGKFKMCPELSNDLSAKGLIYAHY